MMTNSLNKNSIQFLNQMEDVTFEIKLKNKVAF